VAGAAERLGISKEAVRKRISRGTMRADKGPDGTVRVYVPASETTDRSGLVEALRDQVEDLRQRLDREQEANRENRRLLAAALERIPELEAPSGQEPREAPVNPGPTHTPTDTHAGPQASPQPRQRAWWRRIIRG